MRVVQLNYDRAAPGTIFTVQGRGFNQAQGGIHQAESVVMLTGSTPVYAQEGGGALVSVFHFLHIPTASR